MSRGKLKGEKMSLEVKKVAGYEQAPQTSTANSAQKAQQEKEKLNNDIQQALLGNSKAQESRKAALAEQYTKELDMTNAEAKKAAQTRVDDEVAEERISGTDVYYNKSEYEKAKAQRDEEYDKLYKQYRAEGMKRREAKKLANAEAGEVTYLKNRKVRKFIDENKNRFFNEKGEFDQDKFKTEIKEWSGDNKLDLSESRAASEQYDVKAKTIRKSAKYANFDVQNDKTALKRLGHVAESTAIGGGVGAAVGALLGPHMKTKGIVSTKEHFTSTVIDSATGQVIDKITTTRPLNIPVEDKIGAGRGALYGAASGAAGGLVSGLVTMRKVKDEGEKDVFNGISAEEIVKEKGLGVEGSANKKLVDGILKMENLTDEQKVELFKKHYGENTGKRVTQRELVAAYEEAKALNSQESTQQQPTPTQEPDPIPEQSQTQSQIDECPNTPGQEDKTIENQVPVYQYKPKKGEYWSGIVSAKYNIKGNDLKEAVHELKKQHGITNFKLNVQPKVLNLPETLKVGEKEYGLKKDADVKEKAKRFAPASKYTGKYTNPVTKETKTVYFYTDCNGNRSKSFNSAAERDAAMNKAA